MRTVTDLERPDHIEGIVGASRHRTKHYGRSVSAQQRVYILHSAECRDSGRDLRECPYSIALDRGIGHMSAWLAWHAWQDQAVRLKISRHGDLVPDTGQALAGRGA